MKPDSPRSLISSEKKIRRMGLLELPGGYVMTGGVVNMPGVTDLARDIFRTNVRTSIPTYIGVREPQFTVGLGTLQFAHRNAKIQGKVFQEGIGNLNQAEPVPSIEKREKPRREQKNKPKKKKKNRFLKNCKIISLIKIKRLLRYRKSKKG